MRTITTQAEADALAPESLMLAEQSAGGWRQAWQKRPDGQWSPAGVTMAVDSWTMFGGSETTYLLVHEAEDQRPGHRKAADLTPQLIDTLKRYCAKSYPEVTVAIRRSQKPSSFGARKDTYVNVSCEFPSPSTAQARLDLQKDLEAVARSIGFPTAYLNVRQKQAPMAERPVTMQEIQPRLKALGIQTSHDRKRAGFRIRQHGDTVAITVDFDVRSEALRSAEALAAELTEQGYAVSRTETHLSIGRAVEKPATDLDQQEGEKQ
jgi:hypothetical protein